MVFLGVTATPHVFTVFLSPIVSDSYRLRLIRADLKLSGIKETGRVKGVSGLQKTPPLCFHFAFILLSTVQIAREIERYKENSFTLKQCKRTKN